MDVDIYSLEENKDYGPIFVSFDHELLLELLERNKLFSDEGMKYFTEMFFPKNMREIRNGLKMTIPSKEIKKSSLVDKLSESESNIHKKRGDVLDKYGVSSPENYKMVQVQKEMGNMFNFSKYILENSKDVFITTHNAKPTIWDHRRVKEISGLCSIYSADINTRDSESQTYTGSVHWSDNIERVNSTSQFIAQKIPKEIGFQNRDGLFVRSKGTNALTGGYHFTLLSEFDKTIEKYVNKTIFG